ncbi:MAG: helix-turn-helix domain-containing protein [bacterium]
MNQVPAYMIKGVEALIAPLPEPHRARVIDALKRGPRVKLVELARECKVTRRTVWQWIKDGKLPKPMAQGKRLRFWEYNQVSHLMK